MLCDLNRELHLGRLARHLVPVVKIDDPHARRFAYRRAGAGAVAPRDDLRAAEIVRARRRAMLAGTSGAALDGMISAVAPAPAPASAPDDLVERMAESLVRAARYERIDLASPAAVEAALVAGGFSSVAASRSDLVVPALVRARAKIRWRGFLDRGADAAAWGAMLMAFVGAYCVLCPPAHAAGRDALLTDERLYLVATLLPIAVVAFIGVAWCVVGPTPRPKGVDETEVAWAVEPARATTVPDLAALEQSLRDAHRG